MNKILELIAHKEFYGTIITIIVGYLVYLLIVNVLHIIINNGKDEFERKKRVTVLNLCDNIVKWIVWILIIVIVLKIFGVNTSSVLASIGVVGIIIGLALQETVKDVIGGMSIILGHYFVVGDTVEYNGFMGTVIDLNLKATKIQKFTGEVKVVANKNIDEIINLSEKKATHLIKIPTAYEEPKEKVEVAIARILVKARNLKAVSVVDYLGIDDFGESCVYYAIRVTCRQDKRWDIKREVLGIIKDEYEACDIKIPYHQVEIRKGKDIK